jgi:hypothetical protein
VSESTRRQLIVLGIATMSVFSVGVGFAWPGIGSVLGGVTAFAWGLVFLRPLLAEAR